MATRVRLSIIGDTGGDERRAEPLHGGCVGRGNDHDRPGQALGAEVVLQELPDLSASLTDERDHRDLGIGAARDHGQEAGLADPGPRHDADALTPAARHQGVERPHAEPEGGVDARSAEGGRGLLLHPDQLEPVERWTTIDRAAQSVEDPTTERVADADPQRAAAVVDRGPDLEPAGVPER
jgi:hypothetical protein